MIAMMEQRLGLRHIGADRLEHSHRIKPEHDEGLSVQAVIVG